MSGARVSFLTPYWSGAEMMELHLRSIRQFHPDAPILVSKKGGGVAEMDRYRAEYGVEYWLDEGSYNDAYFRLLQRCKTEYACFLDHDALLLASLDPYLDGIGQGAYALVGVEEVVREAASYDWRRHRPELGGWLRYAPGQTASNFLVFNWREFRAKYGLWGVFGRRTAGAAHFEFDYGIGQRIGPHHYLRPYHTARYGLGNLLCDGDRPVAWHQWYGSHQVRFADGSPGADTAHLDGTASVAEAGQRAFLQDYPHLRLDTRTPAWGPGEAAPPTRSPVPSFLRERLHILGTLSPGTLLALARDLPRTRRRDG